MNNRMKNVFEYIKTDEIQVLRTALWPTAPITTTELNLIFAAQLQAVAHTTWIDPY
jgi:hypothetical protein